MEVEIGKLRKNGEHDARMERIQRGESVAYDITHVK
jgi:hypothetical protein